MVFEKAVLVL